MNSIPGLVKRGSWCSESKVGSQLAIPHRAGPTAAAVAKLVLVGQPLYAYGRSAGQKDTGIFVFSHLACWLPLARWKSDRAAFLLREVARRRS